MVIDQLPPISCNMNDSDCSRLVDRSEVPVTGVAYPRSNKNPLPNKI